MNSGCHLTDQNAVGVPFVSGVGEPDRGRGLLVSNLPGPVLVLSRSVVPVAPGAPNVPNLSRRAALYTCVHYARLSGVSGAQAAARMGLMSPVAPARFCNAESAAEAKEYFHIDFGLGILRPRHYSPRARLLEKIEQRSVA